MSIVVYGTAGRSLLSAIAKDRLSPLLMLSNGKSVEDSSYDRSTLETRCTSAFQL